MTTKGTAKVTFPTDEQILITREFDAPRHLVYKAWTTPELVKQYWSGHRGSMSSVEIDLRVGGSWRYVMGTNGGQQIAFHGEFRDIVENQQIIYTEVFEGPGADDSEPALNTAIFTEQAGRTRLTLLTEVSSKEIRDAIIATGMEDGMQEQMDLLEELAASLA